MAWIKHINYESATGKLKKLYDRVKGPNNNVDNIMLVHSLRPHSMEGHMALYKYVLHHSGNSIDKWFLEALGVYTSMLNQCQYCVEHHFSGMKRLVNDTARSTQIYSAFQSETLSSVFSEREIAAFEYAKLLTINPASLSANSIENLQKQNWNDGEILEINQVVAYFNYANRTVLGLGVSTTDDIIGLSPNDSDNPNDWSHN
jgi:uncharacterized peroxidase-related enzyme